MRTWVDDETVPRDAVRDKRWVMRCDVERADGSRCPTTTEPEPSQPDLHRLAREGWFIAEKSGDVCPDCLAHGYVPSARPHPRVMGGQR